MTAADPSLRRRSLTRAVRVGGVAVAVLAVALCARTLAHSWPDVRSALAHAGLGHLAVALAADAAAMTGLGLLWWRCLSLFGAPVAPAATVAWYFGGELGKYLPGGVWTVLGRGELAGRDARVSRATAYATTLIAYGVMTVAAALVCGVLAPAAAAWGWALTLLVPAAAIGVHPAVVGRVSAAARRLTRGRLELGTPSWPQMLRLVAWSVPSWLLVGAAAVAVTESLGLDASVPRVAFAAVAAWIVGFLAVPVPAGAGVRELLFVGLSGLEAAPATTVAVTMRALLIVVDAVGGGIGLGYAARRHLLGRHTRPERREELR